VSNNNNVSFSWQICLKLLEKQLAPVVLQRKRFAFELFFCWANAGFFTFSSKTRSMVSTYRAPDKKWSN